VLTCNIRDIFSIFFVFSFSFSPFFIKKTMDP
jgi:hypothetical protein